MSAETDEKPKADTVESAQWVKDKRGVKRLKVEQITKTEYATRRREPPGFHRGARVRPRTMNHETRTETLK